MPYVIAEAGAGIVDASLVEPIVTAITSNVNALLPVGISIMAIFVGVRLIPRMVHMFM